MASRNLINEKDITTIYESQTFPYGGKGYVYNLHPDLAQKVREAFFTFDWDKPDGTPTSLKVEFEKSNQGKFIPITYKEHFEVIRMIDKVNGVSYDCK